MEQKLCVYKIGNILGKKKYFSFFAAFVKGKSVMGSCKDTIRIHIVWYGAERLQLSHYTQIISSVTARCFRSKNLNSKIAQFML
jgi:hypothetical protein